MPYSYIPVKQIKRTNMCISWYYHTWCNYITITHSDMLCNKCFWMFYIGKIKIKIGIINKICTNFRNPVRKSNPYYQTQLFPPISYFFIQTQNFIFMNIITYLRWIICTKTKQIPCWVTIINIIYIFSYFFC